MVGALGVATIGVAVVVVVMFGALPIVARQLSIAGPVYAPPDWSPFVSPQLGYSLLLPRGFHPTNDGTLDRIRPWRGDTGDVRLAGSRVAEGFADDTERSLVVAAEPGLGDGLMPRVLSGMNERYRWMVLDSVSGWVSSRKSGGGGWVYDSQEFGIGCDIPWGDEVIAFMWDNVPVDRPIHIEYAAFIVDGTGWSVYVLDPDPTADDLLLLDVLPTMRIGDVGCV